MKIKKTYGSLVTMNKQELINYIDELRTLINDLKVVHRDILLELQNKGF